MIRTMKNKPTPGPIDVVPTRKEEDMAFRLEAVEKHGGARRTKPFVGSLALVQNEADARLYAASPALLEACKTAWALLERVHGTNGGTPEDGTHDLTSEEIGAAETLCANAVGSAEGPA